MKSLYQAYQAYERRVERDEFSAMAFHTPLPLDPFLAQVGDLLIRAGLKLKRRHATGKSMAWSPMTGSKQ